MKKVVRNQNLLKLYKHCLQQKNGNEKQQKKTPKRPNIEFSMDSSSDLIIELTNFQNDLDIIKDSLESVVKKNRS